MFKVRHEFQLATRRGYAHSAKANLTQFPLRLSYAQTAHKSQVTIIKSFFTFTGLQLILKNLS